MPMDQIPRFRPCGVAARGHAGLITRLRSAALLAALSLAAAPAAAQHGAAGGEWRYNGGGPGGTRYAPLDQIDRGNAASLEIAWRWKAANFGPAPEYNYRTTPLMVDGVLYATAGYRRAVAAIDAGTGETLWTYRLDEGGRSAPRRNSGRGVAYWESPAAGPRVFLVTPGFHLVALDARSGFPIEDFGDGGVIDLRLGLGRELDLRRAPIGSTAPPIVVAGVVVVGSALPSGARPPSPSMPPGHVRGYDAVTGELRWTFHTIPQAGEYGNDTWEDGSWRYTGNAAVWTALSADPELGHVYLPVELGTGDYYGGHRPGDNLFSQSLVALDAATGERVWHFQTVHHGVWDYDPPAAPVLADLVVGGREIKAVAQITKQTFTFVFDRRTGEPVWPIEERPVPRSDVPASAPPPPSPSPRSRRPTTARASIPASSSTSPPSFAPRPRRSCRSSATAPSTRRRPWPSKGVRRARSWCRGRSEAPTGPAAPWTPKRATSTCSRRPLPA